MSSKSSREPVIVRYFRTKEIDDSLRGRHQSQLLSTKSMIDRLGLDYELVGHNGCVNCLEWNSSGSLLASGSDDFHVMLWDPFHRRRMGDIDTHHLGNIFSVKFMPQSSDGQIASGAGDGRVKVHWVDSHQVAFQCSCHGGRVKRLAVAPDVPYMLWSGAEDGAVMQFDLRTPHSCTNGPSRVLVNLWCHSGSQSEVKSIAINPLRTEQLAVGANDPYVRLYDRRMIKITRIEFPAERLQNGWARQSILAAAARTEQQRSAIPLGCVQYFAPAHLPRKLDDYRRRFRSLASTYVTFDPSGRYLLANLGGEQVYLYDCHSPNLATTEMPVLPEAPPPSNGLLSPEAEQIKAQANACFQQRQFTTAIGLYGKALAKAPHAAVLYSNRAAAFLKRNWDGDVYAALRDCCCAVKLDAHQLKAFHRIVRCFIDLGQPKTAQEAIALLKKKFPNQANSEAVHILDKDIKKKLAQHTRKAEEEAKEPAVDEDDAAGASSSSLSASEHHWRSLYWDYTSRYCGHCNITTDIKEASFFGSDGQYIMAGSDDGCFFVWDRKTGTVERVLRGDTSIVNCIQPHPSTCLVATSGIESVVRFWSPLPEERGDKERVVDDIETATSANQRRMNADPFEMFLMNMGALPEEGLPIPDVPPSRDDDDDDDEEPIQCRPS